MKLLRVWLLWVVVFGFLFAGAVSSKAVSVTVQELSVDPAVKVKIGVEGFYEGYAYAGLVNLLVDGAPMDAFCIDPFHFSSRSALSYEVIPLMDGPKPPGGAMGEEKAAMISKLWTLAYSPGMLASQAAGLQLAIWEVIGGDDFTLLSSTDFGAANLLTQAEAYTGPTASLLALTGDGQDYVVARVPEGGATLILLSISLLCLARLRKY